jgi:hypothetical protein
MPLGLVKVFQARLRSWLIEEFPEAMTLDDRVQTLSDDFRGRLKTTLSTLARSVLAAAPKNDLS